MLGLGILCAVAGGAVVAYHMVRPNHRDMRVSMGHLLPTPPTSSAPKRRFSIRSLVASWRFWLRLLCVGLAAFALYPLMVPMPPDQDTAPRFRIVLDGSASMAVENTPGVSRLDTARLLALAAFERMSAHQMDQPEACIDVAFVTGGVTVVPAARSADFLGSATVSNEGSPVATLLSALRLAAPSGCGSSPTHVVVVTDQPAQPFDKDSFDGHVIWQQVGAPRGNLAIWSARIFTGALRDVASYIDVRVASFGTVPSAVSATVEGPDGTALIDLRQDETRQGGWRADIPFTGAGTYRVTLSNGGGLAVDDAITLVLGDIDRVAVDWAIPDMRRPAALLAAAPETRAITVAQYAGPSASLPEGPFVLVYAGWPASAQTTIGPFMRDHPILSGVNFDVFEGFAPTPIDVPEGLGLATVIRPNGQTGTWIAVRDAPHGAIVPFDLTRGDDDITNLSKVLFFNALSWVAEGENTVMPQPQYINQAGHIIPNALAESNTARALSDPASLALLAAPPRVRSAASDAAPDRTSPFTPWLLGMVLVLILLERSVGLIWNRQGNA